MTISPHFSIGSTVYLKVAPTNAGMVTSIVVNPGNVLAYMVSFGDETDVRFCYEMELTSEKSFGND